MARRRDSLDWRAAWLRHEQLYVGVFFDALSRLAEAQAREGDEEQDENAISKALYLRLRDVCHERRSEEGIKPPEWEAPIPPESDDDMRKHAKRPDFTCRHVDPNASDPASYQISLHVECKRLGEKKLNRHYVKEGVRRFDSNEHQYGRKAPSGMMIGYIVSSKASEILSDVNRCLQKASMPEVAFGHCKPEFDVRNSSNLLYSVEYFFDSAFGLGLRLEMLGLFARWCRRFERPTGPACSRFLDFALFPIRKQLALRRTQVCNGRVNHCNGQMRRRWVIPEEFKLIHCWADLRGSGATEDAVV